MKKLAIILIFALLLAGCGNGNSETSPVFDNSAESDADVNKEIPFVYISYSGWPTGKETIYSATDWHLVTNKPSVEDEEKIGTRISEFRELRPDYVYVNTILKGTERTLTDYYKCDCYNNCTNSLFIDVETGELECCSFNHFPEGYDVRTERIRIEEAEDCIREFCAEYSPHVKLEEYVIDHFDDNRSDDYRAYPEIRFVYKKYKNDIILANLTFYLDKYGNVVHFRKQTRIRDDRDIPYITDDEYLEMAKVRIYEFYEDYENVIEIKDFSVREKTGGYDWTNDSYFVAIDVSFTVIYDDGSQLGHRNDFIYYLE